MPVHLFRRSPSVGSSVWRSSQTAWSRWPASSRTSTGLFAGGLLPLAWWPSSSYSTASDGSRSSTGRWSTRRGRTPSASSCPSPPWCGYPVMRSTGCAPPGAPSRMWVFISGGQIHRYSSGDAHEGRHCAKYQQYPYKYWLSLPKPKDSVKKLEHMIYKLCLHLLIWSTLSDWSRE